MRLNIQNGQQIVKQYQNLLKTVQQSDQGKGPYRDRAPEPDSVDIRDYQRMDNFRSTGSESLEIRGTLGNTPRLEKTATNHFSNWTADGKESGSHETRESVLFEMQPDGMLLYEVESQEEEVNIDNPGYSGRASAVNRSSHAKMLVNPSTGAINLLELEIA
jgi:hypothetical protein